VTLSSSSAAQPSRETSLVYVDTAGEADQFLASIAGTKELALDTEGASFHRYVDRIYLLQLSTRDRSAIIDPLPIGTPARLGALVQDESVEVVFHDADYDLRLLHQDYGWRVTRIFDTRIAAQLLGLKAFGLAALLERYFGVKLDKKHQRADWSLRPLTPSMLDYAAQDTRYLLDLKDRLKEELERAGRYAWAAEEFGRLTGTRWEPEDESQAFMKIKGARDLTRRELAVLRELVPWRERVAAQLDRATFRVMSNEAMLDVSRAGPRTREALVAVRGVARGLVEARGQELLEAIERGLAVPEAELPRFPKGQRWEKDPEFENRFLALKGVRDAAAERLELDPGVLCSRERLEAVARLNPRTVAELVGVPELRRWQVGVLGEALVQALAGYSASPYKPD
jgi:ribonuclease D